MTAEGMLADVDRAKADAFAGRLLAALNDGALCLMVSVGHRTGLFDAMSGLPPATSQEPNYRSGGIDTHGDGRDSTWIINDNPCRAIAELQKAVTPVAGIDMIEVSK